MEKQLNKWEWLAIGLIVAVLVSMAVIAIRTARANMRDSVRLTNVREIQLGLELFFNDVSSYPQTSESLPLGTISTSCLSRSGFRTNCSTEQEAVYTRFISMPPQTGLRRQVNCGETMNTYCYQSTEDGYRIEFELERSNSAIGVARGVNCATRTGITAGVCQ
jgi:hypothetical protein